ncbi:MAG TPA: GNAT family N-acetyltransferase [Rhizomicrobium sp.]
MRKTLRMEDLALTVRQARQVDAADIARVYIEAWHDTYPAMIPHALLCGMTLGGQTARWKGTIARHDPVLVAEDPEAGVIGMASFGRARDGALGLDGEVYTLYVDPAFLGRGAGRALLSAAFAGLSARKCDSCVIWAHAQNNARFFYEAMGGRLVAERVNRLMGTPTPEAAFGWTEIANGPH